MDWQATSDKIGDEMTFNDRDGYYLMSMSRSGSQLYVKQNGGLTWDCTKRIEFETEEEAEDFMNRNNNLHNDECKRTFICSTTEE